ncbi:mucin-5B [Rousettus aegyptiacus]|uniref:mucin-5B n=1 Tax=Rousettus aegyptiacus TaxID=9407 RepID=UPI00168D2ED8|nr:mucin-5B [Rousettus aegyptiacus]
MGLPPYFTESCHWGPIQLPDVSGFFPTPTPVPAETQGSTEPSLASTEAAANSRRADTAQRVTFIPPVATYPTMSTSNAAHNGRVCSTWGDSHYKTFDGDVFRFPGRCNYVFSAHCGAAYEDFNIQLRRGLAGSRPTITHIVLKSQGLVLEVSNGSVLIDGRREELPYSRAGLLVEQSSDYTKVNVRLMLTFMWNGEDSALLELDPKYANQTCGLCGDFNGLRAVNEFYAHNARLTPLQFGNLQKLDGPTEQCQDPPPAPADNCTDRDGICHRTLLGAAFAQCSRLVDAGAYVAACVQDLCRCPSCPCATFAEYSRQCAHAGGQPQNWRGPDFCPRTCPLNLQHQECGSPCADTCSNPERSQLCEDHCVDGCFCPPGTVLDDITNTGCLPLPQCPCAHGGRAYAPGASFSTPCSSCTCSGGLWQCQDLPCPGTCSVQGGSHISTYDEKLYDLHGDCSYVLSKRCVDNGLTVLAELRKCGLTDSENCLKAVTLSMGGGATTVRIQANGGVLINSIYTQLPVSAANITMFRPSTFFILVQTGLGLQLEVQLVPLMQVVLRLDPAHRGQMCGLCGNFNQNQADDLRALSGVVEGTAAAFANTWKTQAACPNVKNIFEDPCSLSVENENYAQHWCSLLTSPAGAFSPCHSVVNPAPFHSNCLFDTCNCERSEECLCAALSSYARACAAQGVLLRGWRDGVCAKYMSSCPESQVYTYVVDRCQPTCRALSQADVTCAVPFVPVDGCTCPNGTFLNDAGTCVSAEACPCYFRGSVVAPGEVLHDNGMVCSCARGKLNCLGATEQTSSGCVAPMVYLDCSNASVGTPGAECLRSCHTLDVDCFSTHCMSGCVCPPGLVSDGSGGCVAEEDCPCLHNEAAYRPGDTIRVDCNTCTCKSRRWECSHLPCLGTCVAYGDGHFITFDGEWYSFDGSCEYTLAQDHCGGNGSTNGTFRIVTENVPCGTTGVTCSKAIKLFLENYELTLHEGTYKAVQRGPGGGLPYRVRYMGTHLAIEARSGLVVSWDRKTSVLIRLQQDYKGRVCGLCGNFDDNAANDFTTRSQSVVGDVLEFGNSWKFSPSCPDAPAPRDPCTANPYRKSWAQKQCSIINGPTFAACRSQVDPAKYYEACVSDACACDSGGDCECFCTAVAAYAQACRDVGVCVSWRTPDVCPLFCDYYNPQGECEWHYQPCGAPCLRTCRNPSGSCLMDMPGLEGCYPRCPPSKPFFSEDQMKCVAQCGCHDQDGKYYEVGASVPTTENCRSCDCTPSGIQCTHSPAACKCTYEGKTYGYGDVVYNTTDGLGACLVAVCGDNGTIARWTMDCPGALSTTPFTFTSTAALPSTTSPAPTLSTVCVREVCHWSAWYDSGHPEPGMGGGDFETFANLRQKGHQVCLAPAGIECRAQRLPDVPLEQLGQKVECSRQQGLTCLNSEQSPPLCHNYELRVLCCDLVPCSTAPGLGTSQEPTPTPTLQATTALTSQTQPTSPATAETRGTSSSVAPGTTCQPQCWWTEWFDEDYPKSEEAGGDIESYDKIRSAGGTVCEWPQDIECRAEHFPDRSPEELGQRVHCDPRFGLVCRNDEQVGLFKMCYNYRIRVLCCSQDHCEDHTTTTATTTATSTTTVTTTKPPVTEPWTWPGSSRGVTWPPSGSTTAMPFHSTGSESPTTSPNPRHTDTLETLATRRSMSPPSSTKTTTLGRATTPQGTTGGITTTRPTTGTPVGTAGTASVSTRPASHSSVTTQSTETSPRMTSSTEATTSQSTTACQPKCEWTEWFDVDFPTSGVTGGDMETYENIRAAGGHMCREPQKIECRAESYPEVSIDQIGQVVSCSLQAGLVCRNRDQKGHFNMCFNYNVRVLCCDDASHCATTTQTPTTTAQEGSYRTARTTGRASPTETTRGPRTTGRTAGTSLLSATLKPSSTSHTATTRTAAACTAHCAWTDWYDTSFPMHGTDGGEFETYANIRAAGRPLCERPVALQCRAELLPDVPLQQLGQVVECGLQDGLVCRNRDQHGRFKMCLNYQIRVLCCDYSHCASTAPTSAPRHQHPLRSADFRRDDTLEHDHHPSVSTLTAETKPSSPGTSQRVTTTTALPGTTQRVTSLTSETGTSIPGTTETVTTSRTEPGPSSPGTTQRITSLTSETGTSVPRTPQTITTTSTTTTASEPGPSSPGTSQRVTTTTSETGPSSSATAPRASTGVSRSAPVPEATSSLPGTTPGPSTTAPVATGTSGKTQTSSPVASEAGSTACQAHCAWTDWYDTSFPLPGADGGEFETYANIRAAGRPLCERPVALQCRAELLPDVPLQQLGQVVVCGLQDGLVCRNRDQHGRFKMCLNYQIRVLCCDYSHCASTAPTSAPATSTRSGAPTSGGTTLWSTTTTRPLPSSPGTTQRVTTPTSETGISSTGTTQSVSTLTAETKPSAPGTSQRVTTTTALPGTTQRVTSLTSETGTSIPGTTETVTTSRTEPGPSSPGTTQRVTSLTSETGTSVPRTPQTITTTSTTTTASKPGPSSPGTTQRVTTATSETGPSSSATAPRATSTTSATRPSSPGTSQRVTTTTSLPGTTQRSPGTSQRVTTTTSLPGTTQRVTTTTSETGPSSSATAPRATSTTSATGPSSPGTSQRVTTTTSETGPSSVTAPRATSTTSVAGPSSSATAPRATTTTSATGPSSPGSSQRVTTTTSLPGTTQRVTTTTSETGPSSSATAPRASTGVSRSAPVPEATSSLPGTTPGPSTTAPVATGTSGKTQTSSPVASEAGSTACQAHCAWTDWYDTSFPLPGADGGEFETYANIRAAGRPLCERPVALQCRAELLPDVPLQQLGQVVVCGLQDGLVCRNRDQHGRFKMCLNYQIRVLCCDYSHCASTAPTSAPATSTRSGAPTSGGTTLWSTTTTRPLPSSPGTTQRVTTPTSETGISSTGTTQSVSTLTAETKPSAPGTSQRVTTTTALPGTTQRVTSLTSETGTSIPGTTETVTTSRTEPGPSSPGTTQRVTSLTSETGTSVPRTPQTITTTSTTTTTASKPGPSSPGTTQRVTTATSETATGTSGKTQTSSPVASEAGSTACQAHCAWTDWYDTSFPLLGADGGEFETYANIRAAGRPLCERPVALQCRAELLPNVPLQQLGQVVECGLQDGLVCRNRDQHGRFKMCLNYQIRVLCCDYSHCASTAPTSAPATSTRSGAPTSGGTTLWSTTTTRPLPSSPGTTQRVTTPTSETGISSTGTTQSVSTLTAETKPSAPGTSQRVTTTTALPGTTQWVTSLTSETGTSIPGTTETVTTSRTEPGPSSPGTTQRVTSLTSETGTSVPRTPQTITTTSTTTTASKPGPSSPGTTQRVTTATSETGTGTSGKTQTSSPVASEAGSTACQAHCAWTDWYDTSFPLPGADGGEFETYANIRAAGRPLRERPVALQCRAELLPDVPLQQLGQVVVCGLQDGLVCRNRDQHGRFKMCLNYQIRVLCCDYSHCASTAPTSAPATSTRSGAPTSGGTTLWSTTTTRPLPSSPGTTQRVTTPTSETGISSTGTTQSVSTLTAETKPSAPGTSQRVTTTTALPGTTQRVTSLTSETGTSIPGTTETVTTSRTEPGPSSPGTTQRITSLTSETGTSVPRTPQTITTTSTTTTASKPGPSSPGTTQRVTTATSETGPSSSATAPRATSTTSATRPSSPGTSQRVTTTTSLPGTTQRVTTTTSETGPSSSATRVTTTTSETGPSSATAPRATSTTSVAGPSSSATAPRATSTTSATGPSSPGTSQRVTTTTSLPGTTQRVTTTTSETGPSSSATAPRASTGVSRSAPVPEATSSLPGTTPGPSTTAPVATGTSGKTQTSSPVASEAGSTACQAHCAWTDWYDTSFPLPGADGGEFETYANIRAAGRPLCERPVALQCRAELLPDVPLQQLGQVVVCGLQDGLVCRNRDQHGRFKMCLNYQIRVLCCDYSHCASTAPTSAPATSTRSGAPTSGGTTLWSTTTTRPLPSSPGTTQRVTTPTSETGISSTGTTQSVSTLTAETKPSAPGTSQRVTTTTALPGTTQRVTSLTSETGTSIPGTTETVTTSRTEPGPSSPGTTQRVTSLTSETGTSVPRTPQTITTTSTTTTASKPGPSSPGTTQRVTTATSETGPSSSATAPRATSTTSATGPSSPGTSQRVTTTTSLPGTTQRVTTTTSETGSSSPGTSQRVTTTTSLPGTTQRVTTSTSETGPSSSATAPRATSTTSATGPSSPGTTQRPRATTTTSATGPSSPGTSQRVTTTTSLPGTTQRVTTTTSETGPSSSATAPRASTGVSRSAPVPEATSSLPGTTPGPSTTAPVGTGTSGKTQTSSPVASEAGSTACQAHCAWTDWYDTSFPLPGADGGEFETYANIRAAGRPLCERPVALQCRAELLPDVPLQQLGQVVECGLQDGLVCRNRDQHGRFKMCLNYQIRVLCCDYSHCASTAPTSAPATSTRSGAPTSGGTTLWSTTTTRPLPSSPGTTQRVTTPTSETGISSTGTTQSVSTLTAETKPSAPGTSQRVTTTTALPGTTQRVTSLTSETGTSIPGTTETVTTSRTEPGPSSPGTTQRVTSLTSETGTSVPRTPQTITTTSTTTTASKPGPSSPGTTQRVTTATSETGPSSSATAPRATSTTSATGPSSPGTSQRVTTTTSLPGTTQRVTTTTSETGSSSPGTSQRVTTTTSETGSSSPGTSQRVTTTTSETGPSSATAPRATSTTSATGPSSSATAPRASTGVSRSAPVPEATSSLPGTTPGPSTTAPVGTGTSGKTQTSSPVASEAGSTACQAHCAWTDWYDTSFPLPGADGGEFETYANIRAAGRPLCERPVALQCRAELLPDVPLQQLGQVVECGLQDGLVCRNWDQHSRFKMCLNYQIRVLCCDYSHCASTAPTSAPATGTRSGAPTSGGTTLWSTTTTRPLPSSPGTTQRVTTPTSGTGPSSSVTAPRATTTTSETGPSLPGTAPWVTATHIPLISVRTTETLPVPSVSGSPGTPATKPAWPSGSASPTPSSLLSSRGPTLSLMPPSPATPCRCRAFGQLFLPGDVVYNKTDSAGCHFYAICTPHCELDRFQGACPTSTPPGPPSAVPPTSAARGCDLADPPRQVNETWTLENCTVAKCEGDNHIALLPPTPVSKVTCVNGREPIKVQSPQDPCESHYECECSCSGWGGSKYRTFDGTNYSFRGNCTHVLVREIQPRFGNLSVLLNSYYCAAAAAPASCPRALVIRYGPTEVTLSTSTDASGREQSLILFDHVRVRSGFSSNGVSVSVTANGTMLVDIPAIGASVTMRGQAFHILLSYSRFGYNTEGQCGTCTNNRTDDCRQPDGTMAPTCQDMAHSWLVPEGCWAPTGPPPTASSLPPAPTTSSASTCPPAPLCKLMLSQVFAECHSLVPPDPFFQTCVSDSCQAGPAVPCQTLEAYAALCRARGACRDWRSATGGLCDLTCPPGKVYEPCGPVHPVTCDSRNHSSENEALAEGCFCPDGHVLFNSYTDVCVPTCPCVGPDGFPKFPGERWVSNCQACECDEGSVAVQCTPVKCEAHRPPPECSQAGFVSVSRPQADNPCCSETLCVCNATTCPQGPPECGPGAELTRTLEEGGCCPTFTCRPKLCTYNGTVYGVGATFPATVPCHTCTCLSVDTQDPTVQCKEEACNTACPQGSEYVRAAGQCCGECVPTACLTPDGRLVQPNETWVDSRVDNCTEYRCQDESGVHMLVPRPVTCRDVSSCRGILRKTGCCYTCEEVDSCQVRVNRTVLRHGDCEALVNVTFCEGSCPGVSKYSAEAQAMQRQCTCCRETSTHQQAVTMQCPGGTAVQRTYTHVDACGCAPSCAPSPAAPEHSTPVLPSYGAIV